MTDLLIGNKMADTLTIRLGVPGDLPEIMELARLSTDENAFLPPDMGKIAAAIWPLLHRDHGLVGCITSDQSRIEGVVILQIGDMWYNSSTQILEEKVVFVHPEYRSAKGGRARKLCQFSKRVAENLGIPLLIGVLSDQRSAAKMRMYQREFGEPSGGFFLWGCTTGAPNGEWTQDAEGVNQSEALISPVP